MKRSDQSNGFTLPAVLVVVAALLILAVGALLVTTVERDTARSFVDRQRAEMAVRAGLEDLRGVLTAETANDDFVVIQSTLPGFSVKPKAAHLFIARGSKQSSPFQFSYIPLFSAASRPQPSPLSVPELAPLMSAGPSVGFTPLPHQGNVQAVWLPVHDDNGRVVARYAYWVEDLQSRVDPAVAGNARAAGETHARVAWPFPAPGLSDLPEASALDQVALFAIDPDATDAAQGDLGKTLIKNRPLLVSPESQLAAAGIRPPLVRLPDGDLADPKANAVERGIVAGLRPYQEQPLVPFAAGIDPAVVGEPKLNLNKILASGGDSAVDEMADFINKALPRFATERKGGFPEDYVKTLAASAIDYMDADKDPTLKTGVYRGIDAYPLVSEYLFSCIWERKRVQGGRVYLDFSCSVYVELWNMTNVPVKGDAEITYETTYGIEIPPDPNPFRLDDLSRANPHNLTSKNGYHWFPTLSVNLQPNEYRLFKCGTVSFSFDVGPEGTAVGNYLTFPGETNTAPRSGYRMRWNDKLVDESRAGVYRGDMLLKFKPDPDNEVTNIHVQRQRISDSIPGQIYSGSGFSVPPNMGDTRMAYYINSPQNHYSYPEGYSPNRRNIRLNLYNSNNNRTVGRVLPSEWPDGGHDSPFGIDGFHGLFGMTEDEFLEAEYLAPDDPEFYKQLPDLTHGEKEAPTRLSNKGILYSVCELGRVYDPVMWETGAGTNPHLGPGSQWGSVNSGHTSSPTHGGGNTLRIGRTEQPRFDQPGFRASHLLDLFHTGMSRSEDEAKRKGQLVDIEGHVNLNTASSQALRQLIAGRLGQDPELRAFTSDLHSGGQDKFPEVSKVDPLPDATAVADRIAGSIINSRPYASTGELARVRDFGNKSLFPGYTSGYPSLQWTDSAAEELFARVFEASTVRSRNFRVWVIGQSLAPSAPGTANPQVLAEVRKNFTVFADPGERKSDSSPDPAKFRLRILHESDF